MKYKFRIKVYQQSSLNYGIKYAYYKFIPNWKTIDCWVYSLGNMCWKPRDWTVDEAEEAAKGFKSIEDINTYLSMDRGNEKDYIENQRNWKKKMTPYRSKEITI